MAGATKTTLWDRWEFRLNQGADTLERLFQQILGRYRLHSRDVSIGSIPVYLAELMSLPHKQKEREQIMQAFIPNLDQIKVGFILDFDEF